MKHISNSVWCLYNRLCQVERCFGDETMFFSPRFGKMHVLDVCDTDQTKILEVAADKYNQMYPGCWNDLMDRSIMDEE